MYFNSFQFAFFFAIVFAVVLLLRNCVRARNAFLLVASYYFYACWDWRFLSLIFISTTVDYLCGLALNVDRADPDAPPPRTPRRKLILVTSLATNLGLLGFFKYCDFFAASAAAALQRFGIEIDVRTLDIVLPVGISFYTFQTLSYTIDLYRGRITTERNPLNFALYVAFFPQLVAGLIERASRLLPQMGRPSRITWPRLCSGFYLICWGLFKKVVLADNIARVADEVFAMQQPTAGAVLIGAYAFAIQIYCDFSAYSDIARGAARCIGFDLMLNFNLPYFAPNPAEFWHRWHISLSTWLRDYLYIPLGGNRRGTRRTYANLMVVMLLGGLWHGAAWTFVLWGLYHGILLCVHRALKPFLERTLQPQRLLTVRLWKAARIVFFFHLTCIGWLIFRADSLAQLASFLTPEATLGIGLNASLNMTFVACVLALLAVQVAQYRKDDLDVIFHAPTPARGLLYAAGILAFLFFGEYGGNAFIYFQF